MKYAGALGAALALMAAGAFAASVSRTEANNGNLVMEDVPPIPKEIVDDLNRPPASPGSSPRSTSCTGSTCRAARATR